MMLSISACAYWLLELDFSLEAMVRFQTALDKGVILPDLLFRKSLFGFQGKRERKWVYYFTGERGEAVEWIGLGEQIGDELSVSQFKEVWIDFHSLCDYFLDSSFRP